MVLWPRAALQDSPDAAIEAPPARRAGGAAVAAFHWPAEYPLIGQSRDGYRVDFCGSTRNGGVLLLPLDSVRNHASNITKRQFAMWNSRKVGILGGGQLGRMLVESANRLNIQANVLDAENAPAKQISAHDGHVTGSFKEPEAVRALAKSCDVVTAEIEHVDTYALEEIASEVQIEPSWQAIRTIQNKFNQKEHLSKYGIPMADHRELVENTPRELEAVGEQLGFPLMLKSKTMAYDGRGESRPYKSPIKRPYRELTQRIYY